MVTDQVGPTEGDASAQNAAATEDSDVPISETPISETPIAEAPVAETPIAEAPPVQAAPVEAPPVAPPVAPAGFDVAKQQRLDYLEQQAAQADQMYQQQQAMAGLNEYARQREEALLSDGVMPERATEIAQREVQMANAALDAQKQAQSQVEYVERKGRAVAHYSALYGVSPAELQQFDDQGPMENYARTQKQLRDNRSEISKLRQDSVEPQTFDGGVSQSGGSLDGEALEQAVGEGTIDLTPEVVKRIIAHQQSQGFGG